LLKTLIRIKKDVETAKKKKKAILVFLPWKTVNTFTNKEIFNQSIDSLFILGEDYFLLITPE
jgi:hypothetical protein